jgi:hypothetical protein
MSKIDENDAVMRTIGYIRVAKIEYEHQSLEVSDKGRYSIGQIVDDYLSKLAARTNAISEFSLVFEDPAQQRDILNMYRQQTDY